MRRKVKTDKAFGNSDWRKESLMTELKSFNCFSWLEFPISNWFSCVKQEPSKIKETDFLPFLFESISHLKMQSITCYHYHFIKFQLLIPSSYLEWFHFDRKKFKGKELALSDQNNFNISFGI